MAENFFGATDTGRLRDNNEDAFIAQEVLNGKYIVGCAIDGVGGYEGGEVAAAIAKDTIIEVLSIPFADVEKTLHSALRLANERIFEEKEKGRGNAHMACVLTLILADVVNNTFYYAHIGDTRLYLLRDQSLVKVTKDHSFVGYLEDSGRLSEESAMNHPKRNEINKALGFDPQLHIKEDAFDIGSSPFLPGDTLFLCSDGLSDMVNSSQMVNILTSPGSLESKADNLIDAANAAGGKDNITVVLIQNDKQRQQHEATKPAVEKATREIPVPEEANVTTRTRTREVPAYEPESKKSLNPLIIILCALLLIALAAAAIWYFTRGRKEVPVQPAIIVSVPLSPQQQQLHDSVAYGGNLMQVQSLTLDSSINITDTIIINRDTLHLQGNGITLHCDSSFRGPVFFLFPGASYVVLENIIFKDFPVAIISGSKGLHLSNVRFINCDVPVQYNFLLPQDQSISGLMSDSFVLRTDSVSSKSAVWP